MFGFFRNKNRQRPVASVSAGVDYQALESRQMMAQVYLINSGVDRGTLAINGDTAADSVTITVQGTSVEALVNGVTHRFRESDVQKIRYYAGPGEVNDHFFNRTSIPSLVYAGAGRDTLIGGEGRDEFYGGDGDDDLQGNGGFDKIHGGLGNDLIRGGKGDDYLVGNDGNDQIWGEDQNDRLLGGKGDDRLYGGDGEDWLYGFEGKDFLDGEIDRDRIFSGGGRFNESRLDPTDFWNDSELIRGGAGQVSRLKGNFSRLADGRVFVTAGNQVNYPLTITANTVVRLYSTVITAGALTRNHFLEVEFDNVTKEVSTIRASAILIHEGNDVTNANRGNAIAFSPGAMHNGGIVGRASSADDVDWYFFRSNISGPVRIRVINPTQAGWAGANIQVQKIDGFVLDETNFYISNYIDVNLDKGTLYWIKASGYSIDPLDYQILFEPLEA